MSPFQRAVATGSLQRTVQVLDTEVHFSVNLGDEYLDTGTAARCVPLQQPRCNGSWERLLGTGTLERLVGTARWNAPCNEQLSFEFKCFSGEEVGYLSVITRRGDFS